VRARNTGCTWSQASARRRFRRFHQAFRPRISRSAARIPARRIRLLGVHRRRRETAAGRHDLRARTVPVRAAWEVALVSSDREVRIFAKTIPYPITAMTVRASFLAARVVRRRPVHRVGLGLPAGEEVATELSYAGRRIQKQIRTSADGTFRRIPRAPARWCRPECPLYGHGPVLPGVARIRLGRARPDPAPLETASSRMMMPSGGIHLA